MNVKMKVYKKYLLTGIVMISFCLLLSACGAATSTDEGGASGSGSTSIGSKDPSKIASELSWEGVYQYQSDGVISQLRVYEVSDGGFDFGLFTTQDTTWHTSSDDTQVIGQHGFDGHAVIKNGVSADYESKSGSVYIFGTDRINGTISLDTEGVRIRYNKHAEYDDGDDSPYTMVLPERFIKVSDPDQTMYSMPFFSREQGQFFSYLQSLNAQQREQMLGSLLRVEERPYEGNEIYNECEYDGFMTHNLPAEKDYIFSLEVWKQDTPILRGIKIGDPLDTLIEKLPKNTIKEAVTGTEYIYSDGRSCYVGYETTTDDGYTRMLVIQDEIRRYRIYFNEHNIIERYAVGSTW
ncbi:MAG: hypothetical protein LBT22_05045 [Peptococcaceae bacterium]|jgi:hypothetical protein|nr:hypothetical protein [Peptococcaceae bacterium]